MNDFLLKFNRYQRGEQMALLALGVVLIVFFVWVLVIAPLHNKRTQLAAMQTAATATLGKVQLMVAQIQQQGATANSGDENINGVIDSSLRAAGLSMSSFQPGANGEVRLRLDRANYANLMQWIYDVEITHSITVKDLSIAATNDIGFVNANFRLQKN